MLFIFYKKCIQIVIGNDPRLGLLPLGMATLDGSLSNSSIRNPLAPVPMDLVAREVCLALAFRQDIRRSGPAFGLKFLLYRARVILIAHFEVLNVAAFVAAHSPSV